MLSYHLFIQNYKNNSYKSNFSYKNFKDLGIPEEFYLFAKILENVIICLYNFSIHNENVETLLYNLLLVESSASFLNISFLNENASFDYEKLSFLDAESGFQDIGNIRIPSEIDMKYNYYSEDLEDLLKECIKVLYAFYVIINYDKFFWKDSISSIYGFILIHMTHDVIWIFYKINIITTVTKEILQNELCFTEI